MKKGTYMNPVCDLQTQDIKNLLSYNPETGKFKWEKSRGTRKKGDEAGSLDGHGYICIQINRKPHRAHNIAWLFITGNWPELSIDHINRVRDDNRAINLREISFSENLLNSPRSKSNRADLYQVGGNHYIEQDYQHWNMVVDTDLHYLIGCATKYISRWRSKNGIQDLTKAGHYITKAEDELIYVDNSPELFSYYKLFYTQFGKEEQTILDHIFRSNYDDALVLIDRLIESELAAEPGPGYTNQDPDYIRG